MIPGTIDEWEQGKDGRWSRRGHPESGVITTDLPFATYWQQRIDDDAKPPEPTLEQRLTKLETDNVTLKTRLDTVEGKSLTPIRG